MDTPIDFIVRGSRRETAEALHDHARRRLSFAVRRFGHLVRQMTVRLVDVNGPRRGVDSRCSVTADLVDGHRLFVAGTAAWPFAAIALAGGRLGEALRRDGERRTARRTGSAGRSRQEASPARPVTM